MLVVVVLAAWFALAVGAALVLGACIRMANARAPYTDDLVGLPDVLVVDDILAAGPARANR